MVTEHIGKAKVLVEHPIMASLTTLTVVGAALTTFLNLTGWYEAAHTSDVEITAVITPLNQEIDNIKDGLASQESASKCRFLDLSINAVEQAIWEMEHAGEDSQRLVEKRRQLANLEDQYRTLRCAGKV